MTFIIQKLRIITHIPLSFQSFSFSSYCYIGKKRKGLLGDLLPFPNLCFFITERLCYHWVNYGTSIEAFPLLVGFGFLAVKVHMCLAVCCVVSAHVSCRVCVRAINKVSPG